MFNMSVLNLSAVSGHRRDRKSAPGSPVVCALALLLCLPPAESQAWGSSRSMQTGHRSPSAFRQCLVRFLVDQPPPLLRVRGERQPVPFVRRKVHDREVYLCRAGKAGSLPPRPAFRVDPTKRQSCREPLRTHSRNMSDPPFPFQRHHKHVPLLRPLLATCSATRALARVTARSPSRELRNSLAL